MIYDESSKTRRLPCIYIGSAELWAERDEAAVVEKLSSIVPRLARSDEVSTYSLTACEFQGHKGIYARDVFNRSTFRRKLARRGMAFDDDPFVHISPEGRFSSSRFGEFDLSFVIASDRDEEDDMEVVTPPPALTAFVVASFRIGLVPQKELPNLVSTIANAIVLGSGEADPLADRLSEKLSAAG